MYSGGKHGIDFSSSHDFTYNHGDGAANDTSIEVNNDMITFKIDLDDVQSPRVEENSN